MFSKRQAKQNSNPRSALDGRTALCFHAGRQRRATEPATFALDASAASQTEVPEGRYDNSPEQARNERRPGLRTQNDFLFFPLRFGVWEAHQTGRKKRSWVGWPFTQGGSRFAPLPWLLSCRPVRASGTANRVGGRVSSGFPLPPPTPSASAGLRRHVRKGWQNASTTFQAEFGRPMAIIDDWLTVKA